MDSIKNISEVDIVGTIAIVWAVGAFLCFLAYVIVDCTQLVENFQMRGFKNLSEKWNKLSLTPNEAIRLIHWAYYNVYIFEDCPAFSRAKEQIANYGLTGLYANVNDKMLTYLFNIAVMIKNQNENDKRLAYLEKHINHGLEAFAYMGVSEDAIKPALEYLNSQKERFTYYKKCSCSSCSCPAR